MAAVAELSFLLFALINNIRAEELITIQKEMDSYTFSVPKVANICLISRFVGEEKLVLWNTSALWSQNSTVPEDLKQRFSVLSSTSTRTFYMIQNLTHSDSGKYKEECWTEGNMTYENNISIIICSTINNPKYIYARLGENQDLPCNGALENLDVKWLKKFSYLQNIWTRVLRDSATSVMDKVTGRPTSSSLHLFNLTAENFGMYNCLVMSQEKCVSSRHVELLMEAKTVYHSVEETAVFQCTIADLSDKPPLWNGWKTLSRWSHSLVLSSLTLNQTGWYICHISNTQQVYRLVVCPKFDPPAVELFSEGDEVTLRCRDTEKGATSWFIKSNQTEGRVFKVSEITSDLRNRLNASTPERLLVISNVSLEDTGEYWCAVLRDEKCLSTTKTVLKHRGPSWIDYTVRCYLLSGLLVVLCVVVLTVNQRTRRGEQRSAETDR